MIKVNQSLVKATPGSAGYDVLATETVTIQPGQRVIVPTGIVSAFSEDMVALLRDKSGFAAKGIYLFGGVIDSDYRKEWGVILHNFGNESFIISKGNKIANLLFVKLVVEEPLVLETEQIVVVPTSREGGFGSTGA